MNIKKAVITAAGRTQRTLPLQSFVNRDGAETTVLQIIVDEVVQAGCEDICIVVAPGDRELYLAAAGNCGQRLQFVEQRQARGYGHALALARDFVGKESFLHLVSDHLYVSNLPVRCAQQ